MFLVFGQFFNQTTGTWQWQQVGGMPTSQEDAEAFAHGFAVNYGFACKVITRTERKMFLPPVLDESALQNAQIQ